MVDLFEDKERGGYFLTASDAEQLIVRPKETYDGALPSGNSAAAAILQRLAALTGDFFWQEAADRQLRFVAGEIEHYPAGYSFSLTALADALYPHRELVCAASGEVPEELDTFLRTHPAENLSILVKTAENADALAACSPLYPGYPLPQAARHGIGVKTEPARRPFQTSASCRWRRVSDGNIIEKGRAILYEYPGPFHISRSPVLVRPDRPPASP